MKKVMFFVAALVMLVVSTSLVGTAQAATNDNIMDIVAADDRFDTLETAVHSSHGTSFAPGSLSTRQNSK